jgi:hypothetical protein
MTKSTGEGKEGGTRSGSQSRSSADDIRQAFLQLPFDQQVSTLIRIELDMLGEAAEYVVSTVSNAFDEIANACSKTSASATSSPSGQASSS